MNSDVLGIKDDWVLRDESRAREIPLKVYYPQAAGPFPVILFSHGLGSSKDGYRYLMESWARRGYVVLVPTHPGSDASLFDPARSLKSQASARDRVLDPTNWHERPLDLHFLLNNLSEIAADPELGNRLDTSFVGVSGHSLGAYTAAALAGVAGVGTYRDERPRAFFVMSPQGEGDIPSPAAGWRAIERPVFAMTGTRDAGFEGQPPEWRQQPYRNMSPGDKYLAVLRDADHLTFTGRGVHASTGYLDPIRELSGAFWDAYLKGDEDARARLNADPFTPDPEGRIRLQRK